MLFTSSNAQDVMLLVIVKLRETYAKGVMNMLHEKKVQI